ncbi:MAG: hypothetical protein HRT87_06025 [Legionellales bacterium]|nr:hypothetical protein [Legionellales bacterium]
MRKIALKNLFILSLTIIISNYTYSAKHQVYLSQSLIDADSFLLTNYSLEFYISGNIQKTVIFAPKIELGKNTIKNVKKGIDVQAVTQGEIQMIAVENILLLDAKSKGSYHKLLEAVQTIIPLRKLYNYKNTKTARSSIGLMKEIITKANKAGAHHVIFPIQFNDKLYDQIIEK